MNLFLHLEYQIEMMKSLRESNADTNTVGWYQTCSFDAFVSSNLTEAQLVYQSTIPDSIVLIVDTSKVSISIPIVRAFQIRPNYRDILIEQSASDTDKFNLIFNEIPVKIQTSVLDKVFLGQESGNPDFQAFSPLSSPMDVSEYVANFMSSLLECTDDSIAEVGKLLYSLRNIVKNSQASSRGKKVNSLFSIEIYHFIEGELIEFYQRVHFDPQGQQFRKHLISLSQFVST